MFYKQYILDYTIGDDNGMSFETKLSTPHTEVWAKKKETKNTFAHARRLLGNIFV